MYSKKSAHSARAPFGATALAAPPKNTNINSGVVNRHKKRAADEAARRQRGYIATFPGIGRFDTIHQML
jgi:ureidoglycolate hydrolase